MRLSNLDYLRGLSAFGIMMYHLGSWLLGSYDSSSFMGRVGVYGVSIFYVLSGLTLFYVYHEKLTLTGNSIFNFWVKRIFRIIPLLWLVLILTIIIRRNIPNGLDLFLNFSGLFGFFDWDNYIPVGAWSIGNELVFYSIFPILVYAGKLKNKGLWWFITGFSISIYLFFAFIKIDGSIALTIQSADYVNPLNQFFLFLLGYMIGFYTNKKSINNVVCICLITFGFVLFWFGPGEGDRVSIVTGFNRLYFTLVCGIICLGFFKLQFNFPNLIHKPLLILGHISYSLYLIHPIVYKVTSNILWRFIGIKSIYILTTYLITILCSLILSYLIYIYFEKYFITKAKQLTDN